MIKRFLIFCIKSYRKHIKHIFPNRKPMCRFYPTCSEYAITALERFGVLKGIILFIFRFLRCNPLFKGGYDPVPQKGENWFL